MKKSVLIAVAAIAVPIVALTAQKTAPAAPEVKTNVAPATTTPPPVVPSTTTSSDTTKTVAATSTQQ